MDCDPGYSLADDYYVQGAIQLALGQHGAAFLPEVIGYNLGYEQLPLHLLITSFELNELGIDPHYFTLHVTIDNASTGHARKAAQSVLSLMPMGAERDEFYRRVVQGYKLNELGIGSTAVIQSFDLEQEVIAMLERKDRSASTCIPTIAASKAGPSMSGWARRIRSRRFSTLC